MKIGIASDHHGVIIKKELISFLENQGYEVINYGTNNEEMVDYPKFAFLIGEEIAQKKINCGILLCGTGIGMSIACNKVKKVRCAKVSTVEEAKLAREHNDANVIALSSSVLIEELKKIVQMFIETDFSKEERHQRRVDEIQRYEEKYDS